MEQSSTNVTATSNPEQLSWFENKCRNLVISLLDKLQKASLEIEEAGQITRLGNTDAKLNRGYSSICPLPRTTRCNREAGRVVYPTEK